MKTFYFNTQVTLHDYVDWPNQLNDTLKHKKGIFIGGVLHLPFDVEDVPEDAVFLFLADTPNETFMVRKIVKSSVNQKYAHFYIAP